MVEENKDPNEEVVEEAVAEEVQEEVAEEVAEQVIEEKPKLTEEQMAWRKKRMQKTEKVLLSNIALGKLKKLYPENIPMGAFELLTEEEKAKLKEEASKLRAKLDSLCSKIDAGEEVDCYCPKNWE